MDFNRTTCGEVLGASVAPWYNHVDRLVTWWQVEEFSAHKIAGVGGRLQRLMGYCIIVPGSNKVSAASLMQPLDEATKAKALEALTEIEAVSQSIGLTITQKMSADLAKEVGGGTDYHSLYNKTHSLQNLFYEEVSQATFFYVPPHREILAGYIKGNPVW